MDSPRTVGSTQSSTGSTSSVLSSRKKEMLFQAFYSYPTLAAAALKKGSPRVPPIQLPRAGEPLLLRR